MDSFDEKDRHCRHQWQQQHQQHQQRQHHHHQSKDLPTSCHPSTPKSSRAAVVARPTDDHVDAGTQSTGGDSLLDLMATECAFDLPLPYVPSPDGSISPEPLRVVNHVLDVLHQDRGLTHSAPNEDDSDLGIASFPCSPVSFNGNCSSSATVGNNNTMAAALRGSVSFDLQLRPSPMISQGYHLQQQQSHLQQPLSMPSTLHMPHLEPVSSFDNQQSLPTSCASNDVMLHHLLMQQQQQLFHQQRQQEMEIMFQQHQDHNRHQQRQRGYTLQLMPHNIQVASTPAPPQYAVAPISSGSHDNETSDRSPKAPPFAVAASATSAPPTDATDAERKRKADAELARSRFRGYQSEQWSERFQELLEYRSEHGDCNVPHTYTKNPVLARWVKRQRYQYKLINEGKPSTMTQSRMADLERIGFLWDSHKAAWHERWMELRAFQIHHGHCNVPSEYGANPQLATWVKCQRRQYKLLQNPSPKGAPSNMTPDRIAKLEKLGFEWELRSCRKKRKAKGSKKGKKNNNNDDDQTSFD